VFGDDAAQVRRLREGVSVPYGVSSVSFRTVTRYVTQVKTNVSRIVAFFVGRAVYFGGIHAALLHGWPAPSKWRTWPRAQIAARQFRSVAKSYYYTGQSTVWVTLLDVEREFRAPSASSVTPDMSGFLGSMSTTQHVLEMFRRNLPAVPARRVLDRLANRLIKIASEARKLNQK